MRIFMLVFFYKLNAILLFLIHKINLNKDEYFDKLILNTLIIGK
jgi:hypothetical protein